MSFTEFMNMWCHMAVAVGTSGSSIFIEYDPLTSAVDIQCYFSGWKSGVDPYYRQTFFFDEDMVLTASSVIKP